MTPGPLPHPHRKRSHLRFSALGDVLLQTASLMSTCGMNEIFPPRRSHRHTQGADVRAVQAGFGAQTQRIMHWTVSCNSPSSSRRQLAVAGSVGQSQGRASVWGHSVSGSVWRGCDIPVVPAAGRYRPLGPSRPYCIYKPGVSTHIPSHPLHSRPSDSQAGSDSDLLESSGVETHGGLVVREHSQHHLHHTEVPRHELHDLQFSCKGWCS